MKKKFAVVLTFCLVITSLLSGCNAVTRNFGGSQTINLEPNTKLVQVTWKDSDLWILTRPMKPGEEAESYQFNEDSNFGVLEGTVELVEKVEE